VFEAGLIVGIVTAVTVSVAGRGFCVAGGVAAGVLGACVVAQRQMSMKRLSRDEARAGSQPISPSFQSC
jgi:hypothetical protein